MKEAGSLSPWQVAHWNREMAAMERRYRFYANETEKENAPTSRFSLDPIAPDALDAIMEGSGNVGHVGPHGPVLKPASPAPRVALKTPAAVSWPWKHAADEQRATEEWQDEGGSYEPTQEELDWLAVQELFKRRESALSAIIKNRSADPIDEQKWRESIEARQQLNADSVWVAQMLHAGGEKGFKPAHAPRAAILDLLTGMVLDLPHTVGKNFIPCEAAKKRARMLISAESWCERNPLDRFWVFHGPGRVLCEELRETIQMMQRKLSKLNGEKFMRQAGVRMNLRITEIGGLTFQRIRSTGEKVEEVESETKDGTKVRVRLFGRKGHRWVDRNEVETVEHRDGVGRWTFYPHINVLAHFTKGKISNEPGPIDPKTGEPTPSDWSRFLSKIHAFWQWGWAECGGLEDIREAIKYCAKPADLRRMSAPEVCAVARALYRLHLAQPLGLLKSEIRGRRDVCVKLIRWRNGRTGRLEIREKPDWNARKRTRILTDAEKWRERERRRLRAELREAAIAELLARGRAEGTNAEQAEFVIKGRYEPVIESPFGPTAPPSDELLDLIVAGKACEFPPLPWRKKAQHAPAVIVNRVVARMVGTSPFLPRVGPQVLVWGYDRTPESLESVRSHDFVQAMGLAAGIATRGEDGRVRWSDAIRVHTSPVTVRGLPLDTAEAWQPPPNPARN